MTNYKSCRLSKEGIDFLKKMAINRIKTGNSEELESRTKMMDAVVKFFKLNNDQYLKLLKTN